VWIDEAYLEMEGWEPPPDVPVILNWIEVHSLTRPYSAYPFTSESEIKKVEEWLKTVPTENFWGIVFIREEIYRTHIAFNDDVDTTWFDETILGYPLYLRESPTATEDEWKSEMYFRMIRGFYNYFSPLTKVGTTVGYGVIMPGLIDEYYGEPAMAFIREYYDFVFAYIYNPDLDFFKAAGEPYLSVVDELFPNQKKFWILTRIWDYNRDRWEYEAIALEMKNCLDRNMVITTFHRSEPSIEEVCSLMLKAIELYDSKAPYYEDNVHGRNLLTGYVGNTYGWVEVLE